MHTRFRAVLRVHFIGRFYAGLLLVLGLLLLPATAGAASLTVPATDSDGNFTVNWSVHVSNGAYAHLLQNVGGNWLSIDSGFGSHSHPVSVSASGTYQFKVIYGYMSECGQWGCSMVSGSTEIKSTVVSLISTPGVPGSISAPGNTYGTYTVSWGAASGTVTKYDLDIRQGSGSYSNLYDGSALSRTTSVSQPGTYYFRVRACHTSGASTSCSDWRTSAGMVASAPPVPVLTAPGSNNSGAYSVSWNGVAGASRYTLQEHFGSRLWTTVQDTAATSRSFSGKGNSQYSYQVRSCSALGCSAYTSPKTVNVVRARTGAATEISYQYDALGRLQFVEDGINTNRDYDYDSAGNRTAVAEGVLSEDEDPFEGYPGIHLTAPSGLQLAGPFSQAGGYTASWHGVANADRYVVGLEDGSQVETTNKSIGTAILRPVWVYAANYSASSVKSYF